MWSHLAWADDPGHPTVHRQARVFAESVALVEARGATLEVRHLANSAATLTDPSMHYDLVRPGLAVYGLSPVPHLGGPADFGLRPAMRLEADLAVTKVVPARQGVSYGHAYTTTRETVLGLVPIGYADGVPRMASGTADHAWGGPVQVGGRRLGVAGRVCMDQFVLDLGRTRRRRPATPSCCSAPATTASPPLRTGRTPPAPSPTRSSRGSAPACRGSTWGSRRGSRR